MISILMMTTVLHRNINFHLRKRHITVSDAIIFVLTVHKYKVFELIAQRIFMITRIANISSLGLI